MESPLQFREATKILLSQISKTASGLPTEKLGISYWGAQLCAMAGFVTGAAVLLGGVVAFARGLTNNQLYALLFVLTIAWYVTTALVAYAIYRVLFRARRLRPN